MKTKLIEIALAIIVCIASIVAFAVVYIILRLSKALFDFASLALDAPHRLKRVLKAGDERIV